MPYGPCVMCGATNYPNSMGGPSICPSCDCGNPPRVGRIEFTPHGCICPPGAEKTCQGLACPRRAFPSQFSDIRSTQR